MNYLHILVTFIVVLFVYIHIQFQLSHSQEKDVYVLDVPVTIPIEEIFELKQPVVMHLHDQSLTGDLTKNILSEHFPKFDMSVYDNTREVTHAHILSSCSATQELFNDDNESRYYTEKNYNFVNTIPPNNIFKGIIQKHQLFEPPLCSRKLFDIMFGSHNSTTSTQYSIMYRNIFTVTKGNLCVKMIHPNLAREHKITVKPNYTDMSFFAEGNIDLWGDKYDETIELVVKEGETFSIPPYWLYSFRYEHDTFVTCSYFNSYMTEIATLPHTVLYWITKFTRPGRAVPIGRNAQPSNVAHDEPIEKPSNDAAIEKPSNDTAIEKLPKDATIEKPSNDTAIEKPSNDTAIEKLPKDATIEKPSNGTAIEKLPDDGVVNTLQKTPVGISVPEPDTDFDITKTKNEPPNSEI